MADIPGNSSTTTSIAVGGSLNSDLTAGDVDWIRVNLVAGETYTIQIAGNVQALDLVLSMYNSSSGFIGSIDENYYYTETASFTADYTGVFYIAVSGFDAGDVGAYNLKVTKDGATLPTFTDQQIATYLTNGYWNDSGEGRHAFSGTSITYNVSGLTAAGRQLAQAAFAQWSAVTGLTFTMTTGAARITLDDSDTGAYATYVASGQTTTSAQVNVGLDWLADYGTAINGYAFQTYLHEIGHALGLGHAGNYNGGATWGSSGNGDNHYLNDSWQATVMSYFDQDDNTSVNASFAYVVGPMIADILAMQSLYGVRAVNTGNTTWGFGSTAGSVFNFANYAQGNMVAFAINDSGGVDTLNASGFTAAQRIDLRAGNYSDIGGETGNIGIAYGVVVENAIGGNGNDTIIGNAAANRLDGRGGADRMEGGAGNDTYIVNHTGDRVIEIATGGVDRVLSSITLALAANVEHLTLTGAAAINGTGNALNNSIVGNAAINRLSGGAGNDTLNGAAGNDTLIGGDGNDTLIGGLGADRLTGGAGADTFRFDAALSATNRDVIVDFNAAADRIQLDNAVMAGLGAATGPLAAAAFWASTTGLAHDASDRIIYETDTGRLYYDANGSAAGGRMMIATLTGAPTITHADFFIV